MNLSNLACCAIQEMVDIENHTPKEIMTFFVDCYYNSTFGWSDLPGFFVLSGVLRYDSLYQDMNYNATVLKGRGAPAFVKYIKKHNLGRVTTLRANYNRENTLNLVKVWVWSPSTSGVKRWASLNRRGLIK